MAPKPARRDQPGARVPRDAGTGPLLDRGRECVVQRLLGEIEIAEEADQRGQDTP